jgi:hypothetical protein
MRVEVMTDLVVIYCHSGKLRPSFGGARRSHSKSRTSYRDCGEKSTDLTYEMRAPILWESHQRKMVDGSDPTYSSR